MLVFQIIERIGQVAYKLNLPDSSKIYHVFHVSLSYLHKGEDLQPLAPTLVDYCPIIQAVAIINQRVFLDDSTQILV